MPSAADDAFFARGWADEDQRIDVYALFVLEDIPVAEIETVLDRNFDDSGHAGFWLADDYKNLPDYPEFGTGLRAESGTMTPIEPGWQSPFLGKTAQEAADCVRSVPKPRKPLCKTYFAILDATRYHEHDQIMICKILEDGRVDMIPCMAAYVTTHFDGYDRGYWDIHLEIFKRDGRVLMME